MRRAGLKTRPGGLVDARKEIERHIRKYLMRIQAPMGAKAKLIAWMEIFLRLMSES